jgi:hypothetical protein
MEDYRPFRSSFDPAAHRIDQVRPIKPLVDSKFPIVL